MDTRKLLLESAERIFADHCDKELLEAAEGGAFPEKLWSQITENGLHMLAMPESGAELGDAFALVQLGGRHAAPIPLLEATLANRWLGAADRLVSLGVIRGERIVDIPWGRRADAVIGIEPGGKALLVEVDAGVEPAVNPSGEARDSVEIREPRALDVEDPAWELFALGRTAAIAGCLERVLELSVQYVNEREQFGRPLAKFQAIQHSLAIMAAEVAAASRAAGSAIDRLGTEDPERFALEVGVAKARVGEACGIVAPIAHQVHGAIGFTHEHQLHHFTRRLWSWRDEAGSERYWQERIGRHVSGRGADRVWELVTAHNSLRS